MMSPRLCLARRPLLLGLLGLPLEAGVAGAAAPQDDRSFKVYRKGSDIGRVQLGFARDGAVLTVRTRWDIAVKLAFVTVYRYRQTADDRWRDDRLMTSAIRTDDDGTVTMVNARQEGEGLLVEGPAGRLSLPPDALTDVCFWNPRITQVAALVDSQHGDLVPMKVAGPVAETVPIGGEPVIAKRFTFTGSLADDGSARGGEVWYDSDGRWIRSEVLTRGERLLLIADA